jgi:hypothetical protein
LKSVLEDLRAAWPATAWPEPRSGALSIRILLALILGTAVAARFLHAFQGLPYLHFWDEPFVASRALHMMKTGTLDPDYFVYGSLPIYLSLAVDVVHYLWLMARPESSPPFLSHIDQIVTHFDTGWLWEISHPSFYLWNRWMTSLIGAGTVLLTFLIGWRLAGRWAGILAAGLLAGLAFHVESSAKDTVDSPMTFLVMLVAYASILFLEEARPARLLTALVACGLAIATKYNGALSICMPLLALAMRTPSMPARHRRWLWSALPVVPVLAFLAGAPFALLNLRQFLIDTGRTVRVYGAVPWAQTEVAPGLEHLTLQGGRIAVNLGVIAVLFALVGLLVFLSRRAGVILLAFGALYALFMGGSRLSYPRNFLVLYPLAAVAFGAGGVLLANFLARRSDAGSGLYRYARTAVIVILAGVVAWGLGSVTWSGMHIWATPESRTQAITLANEMTRGAGNDGGGPFRVGIPRELRIHPSDLARLEAPYQVAPYIELLCRQDDYTHMLKPARWSSYSGDHRWRSDLFNSLLPTGIASTERTGFVANLILDSPSLNPEMEVLRLDEAGVTVTSRTCTGAFRAGDLRGSEPFEVNRQGELMLLGNGWMESPWVAAEEGSYVMAWDARGTSAAGEFAKLRATALGSREGGEPLILAEKTFELQDRIDMYALPFKVAGDGLLSARLEFINDYYSAAAKQDRNAYLSAIYVLRLQDGDGGGD